VPCAYADGTVSMEFTGVNGAHDNQYYVSPYYGTMNGSPVVLFCDDINNEVSLWETWTANVTNLGTAISTNNFSNTRYGGLSGSPVFSPSDYAQVQGSAAKAYEQVAWLTTQFANNPGDYVSLQYAIWDIMNPGSEPTTYGDVQTWLNDAAADYQNIDPYHFEIVTNVGPLCLKGQVQEFIVQTPEPSTLALLLCGLLAFVAFTIARARLAA
ncbi:MAG TPA: PEP-CTERM sorting domain-containing protein, partial [Candidatus Sulfotelmatobacter sp.]|nr:PEP-CTERM sorting domain-containing protein [Candidatus Sulfotelmatobacter sp.]